MPSSPPDEPQGKDFTARIIFCPISAEGGEVDVILPNWAVQMPANVPGGEQGAYHQFWEL